MMIQQFIPRPVKAGMKSLLSASPGSPWSSYYRGLGTCLMYHRVTAERLPLNGFKPNLGLSVHTDDFAEQIRFISENYHCVSLDEMSELMAGGKGQRHFVTVTIDDGYRDNLEHALPILERYGVPAAIYVATGLIDRLSSLWWYEHEFLIERLGSLDISWRGKRLSRPLGSFAEKQKAWSELNITFKGLNREAQDEFMALLRSCVHERYSYDNEMLDWDELRTLSRHPLITIGAHTVHHSVLSRLSDEQLDLELIQAKAILEEKLGKPVKHFSYPFGASGEASVREFEAAGRAGFLSAFTTRAGHLQAEHRSHPYALPRIAIDYADGLAGLRWKLSGMEAMLHLRGRRFVAN